MLSPLVTECRRKDRRIAQLENALAWLPDGTTAYSDGIVQSDRPIATDDLPAVRAEIAGAKGWEDGSFNIISLTRL